LSGTRLANILSSPSGAIGVYDRKFQVMPPS
jgi:hypothetical protein